jgi:omega-6 fatty acid desaturase (delta-12 desaturase)
MGRTHTDNETCEEGFPTNPAQHDHRKGIRIGRDLIKATEPFAVEDVAKSWWYVGSIFSLLIVTLIGAGMVPWWPARLMLSVLGALFMVRAYITYHDYMHGSILRTSSVAWLLYRVYAAFALTPPRS